MPIAVYFSTSIFRAVPLGPTGNSAAARLLSTLSPQLDATVAALRGGCASVVLVPGDIITAMTAQPPQPSPPLFDYIDCSNVADYVSLPALLQTAMPLLAMAPHARLRIESLVAFRAASLPGEGAGRGSSLDGVQQYLNSALMGMPLPTYEQLLGLRLMGSCRLTQEARGSGLRMEWGPLEAEEGSCGQQGEGEGEREAKSGSEVHEKGSSSSEQPQEKKGGGGATLLAGQRRR